MRPARSIGLVLLALALAAGPLAAQEWSAEQQEVWNTVQAYWDLAMQRDVAASMATIHPAYTGWSYGSDFPDDYASTEKWFKYNLEKYAWVLFELKPVAITVVDDIAVVHYFYTGMYTDLKKEEDESAQGRWTDILKKEGDKWLLIADHGGSTKDD